MAYIVEYGYTKGWNCMENYKDIIKPMKKRFISMVLEIEKLEGLFVEASAGGIVWKERKKKAKGRGRRNRLIEMRRYAYYQFYDKRKPRGKRKIQKYICKKDIGWAFRWVAERRKKWKRLQELKKEIKKLKKGLSAFDISVAAIQREMKERKLKKSLKRIQKRPLRERCRYLTARGELVRSRAERKIANELFFRGIPYIYEKMISFRGKRLMPDFVFWIKGKMVFLEHLGMLDIKEYAEKWERKKRFYDQLGIHEGVNLIVTTERSIDGLSIERELAQLSEHEF